MNINGLSISEMKELLSKLDNEIAAVDNEYNICNNIAKNFTGKTYTIEYNKKLKADIQIQQDLLEYLNNGGKITYSDHNGTINSKAVKGAKAGKKLYIRGY